MIKIAFFFDDSKTVQTFDVLDFSKVGLVPVGFYSKSKEDIEKLRIIKPQIIMTDENFVTMPESEFVSEIKDVFYKAIFIKLGHHSTFDRVRNAFKLGYTDYITLSDYMADPYEMFLDIISNNDFNTEDSYEVKIIAENDLMKYAYGHIGSLSQRHNFNPESVIFASVTVLNFDAIAKEEWGYQKEQLLFAFKNIMYEIMSGFENGEFFFNFYSQAFFVFTPTKTIDKHYVKDAIRLICDTLRKSLGVLSFGIVKDEPAKLCEFITEGYNKIEQMNKLHLVAHDYVYFSDELALEFIEDFNSTRMTDKIETLLDNLDFEGAVSEIRSLKNIRPSLENISGVEDYLKIVFNGIRHLDIQNQVGLVHDDDINQILATYNIPIAVEYFTCCIYAISDFISEDKYVYLQISKFLQEHLADNITLQDISDNFNFEYTYTSKYFAQIMGMPFKKYFNNLRLSTALNLLKSTDLKCYEIAAMCGYNNYEHFSRIFYKKYEVWPKEIVRQKKQ